MAHLKMTDHQRNHLAAFFRMPQVILTTVFPQRPANLHFRPILPVYGDMPFVYRQAFKMADSAQCDSFCLWPKLRLFGSGHQKVPD